MKILTNLLDRIPIDNKLLAVVLTTVLTRLATYLGLLTTDPTVESGIALLVGAIAGYLTPNDGTVLRRAGIEDDGSAYIPPGEAVPAEGITR